MARVAALAKIYPTGIEVDLEGLLRVIEDSLPEGYKLEGSRVEPVAFGLKALRVLVSMPENIEGGTEELENILKSIEGVSEVEIEAVHRIG